MKILGISAYYHDSAAVLLLNGDIVAAAQEERFTRTKHDPCFPCHSIKYCLEKADVSLNDVDYVVFYDKPFLTFERIIENYLQYAPIGFKSFAKALPIWIKDKLFQKNNIIRELKKFSKHFNTKRLLFTEHHVSHASSAYFPSPFQKAAIITIDGVGEWATTTIAEGIDNNLNIIKEIHYPHSLGLLYSAFTYYLGFKVNSGEYKVMGLSSYGEPSYYDLIVNNLIDIKDDGSFRLDQKYFNYTTGLTMTSNKFHKLFGGQPRKPESPLTQKDMDLAASIQKVIEDVILKLAKYAKNKTGHNNLCLAGGVALNCVANSKILQAREYNNIWVQPAAGDAGGALGAALYVHHCYTNHKKTIVTHGDNMKGAYLGPEFTTSQIVNALNNKKAKFEVITNKQVLIEKTANAIASGKSVGWFQGRMEYGPRALGNRSIIADPRQPSMQRTLNLKIKFRESFRPFAPSVLREELSSWFDLNIDSPYMLFVAKVSKNQHVGISKNESQIFGIDKLNIQRSTIPAVTHVDYSARIQTVHRDTNALYHKLIQKFKEITGCPVLVNTSFNVRGEPIVCTPENAYDCFMGTELDILVIGDCFLEKNKQPNVTQIKYYKKFMLD